MDNQLPEELKKGKLYKIPKMEDQMILQKINLFKNKGRNLENE